MKGLNRFQQNEMYIGNMEQGRDDRLQMHGRAKRKDRSQWTVVVELNEEIIKRENYDTTVLKDGDVVEILHFMGGGSF